MSGPNRFIVNESTSVIKIDTSVLLNGNSTIVYLSSTTLPGQTTTIFDADGYASPLYPIIVSSLKGVSFHSNPTFIKQRFGYVTIHSDSSTREWSVVDIPALSNQQDYTIKGLASLSTVANSISASNFISSGQFSIGSVDLSETLSANGPLHTSTLYINSYRAYKSTSVADPLLIVNDIMDLNSTTYINNRLNISRTTTTSNSFLVGTILSTFGPAYISSLTVNNNMRFLGGMSGSNALTINGDLSISSITTVTGSLTVANKVQSQNLTAPRIIANNASTINTCVIGSATLTNVDPYIVSDTPLYSQEVRVDSISSAIISTNYLMTSNFSPLTTTLKNIVFNTLILNQNGSMETSSIRTNTISVLTDSIAYTTYTSTLDTSSINVNSFISTTGMGVLSVSSFEQQDGGNTTVSTITTSTISIDTLSTKTATIQNCAVSQLNTPITTEVIPNISSVFEKYTAQISPTYVTSSESYSIYEGAPYPPAGTVLNITNIGSENYTYLTVEDTTSDPPYNYPSYLGITDSFRITLHNIEDYGYIRFYFQGNMTNVEVYLMKTPTPTGPILQFYYDYQRSFYFNIQFDIVGLASPVEFIRSTTSLTTLLRYDIPGDYFWTVPQGVTSATVTLFGAGGGGGNQSSDTIAGGNGGRLTGRLAVTPGYTYRIQVGAGGGGGSPEGPGAGGYPGGGSPYYQNDSNYPYSGGGGGGFSAILLEHGSFNAILNTYLAIAGGGGGTAGGSNTGYGGAGGGRTAQAGESPGDPGTQSRGGRGWYHINGIPADPTDDGAYLIGGMGVEQTEGGGGGGYYGGGAGWGGGGGSSYYDSSYLSGVRNFIGLGSAGGQGGTPAESGTNGLVLITFSGRCPTFTIGPGPPISVRTNTVYNGGSLYWQTALPDNTVVSATPLIIGTEYVSFYVAQNNTIVGYGPTASTLYIPVQYSPGDILSVYSDGSGGSYDNYGTAYTYLNSTLITTISSNDNPSPQQLIIRKYTSSSVLYEFSDVLFGPTETIYVPSTISYSTISTNTIIDYVSMQNAYVTLNTLLHASTITVDSMLTTSNIGQVSTCRAPTPFSYLTIAPSFYTDTFSPDRITASTLTVSTVVFTTPSFNYPSNRSLPKNIGTTIPLTPTTPYLTAVDITRYYNGTGSLNPGYFPYYYLTGTSQSNQPLGFNEIIGGTSYEHSFLKADIFDPDHGLILDWFVLNPQSYSNIYLNLRFAQAHASGFLQINGKTLVTFDNMIGSNTTSITLNDFDLKNYPFYNTDRPLSLGYYPSTPFIQLVYYSNNGVQPTKLPLMEIWVSDKKRAFDNQSRLDSNALVTMNKGYMNFSTSVNGINIFNSQNDMSVRKLFYTGALSFASDSILKEQIETADLNRCLQTVDEIPLYRYSYIKEYQSTFQHTDRRRLGILANEYARHFPKGVHDSPEQVLPSFSTTSVVDTEQLLYAHIGATKALISTVEYLSTVLSKKTPLRNPAT